MGEGIRIAFLNQEEEKYEIRLYNSLGQRVLEEGLTVSGEVRLHTITLPKYVSKGYYQLELISASGTRTLQKIVVE